MEHNKSNDLWIFMEIKEDGRVHSSSLELMNPGIEIEKKKEGKVGRSFTGLCCGRCDTGN